jgi:HD-GYP domain-containing protein (c-di-GMP phosphodiesterase class II)
MSERQVAEVLKSIRRLVHQVGLYPEGHPQTDEAIQLAAKSVETFLQGEGETVLTIHEDAFFRNRTVVPHASLEYRGLLQDMQMRGVESITFADPVSSADLYDLAAFIGGTTNDVPADGTVRLNEGYAIDPEMDDTPAARLRGSYGQTLDAMRFVTSAMITRGAFELGTVVDAVEGMFENTMAHPGAALLLSTVKSHDEYTYFHSVNVGILSLAIGQMVGVDREILVPAAVGAVLHDIGKVAVSPAVLNYPGRLSEEQWKEITVHPQEGALSIMAAGGPGSEIAATVAFEHHARFDGDGYPAVTRDGRPHMYSRLVQVVDTYDAITARRSYRRAESPHRALQVLLDGAGSAWDPELVQAFIRMMGVYPPGSILVTDTGATVVVVAPASEYGAPLPAMLVLDESGVEVMEPVPMEIPTERVARQVLPDDAGIDPASLLEVATAESAAVVE